MKILLTLMLTFFLIDCGGNSKPSRTDNRASDSVKDSNSEFDDTQGALEADAIEAARKKKKKGGARAKRSPEQSHHSQTLLL